MRTPSAPGTVRGELLLRADVRPGARAVAPRQLTGARAAAAAPGRVLGEAEVEVPDGPRGVRLVRSGGRRPRFVPRPATARADRGPGRRRARTGGRPGRHLRVPGRGLPTVAERWRSRPAGPRLLARARRPPVPGDWLTVAFDRRDFTAPELAEQLGGRAARAPLSALPRRRARAAPGGARGGPGQRGPRGGQRRAPGLGSGGLARARAARARGWPVDRRRRPAVAQRHVRERHPGPGSPQAQRPRRDPLRLHLRLLPRPGRQLGRDRAGRRRRDEGSPRTAPRARGTVPAAGPAGRAAAARPTARSRRS